MRLSSRLLPLGISLGIVGLLAACHDSSPSSPAATHLTPLQTLACVAQVHAKTVTCTVPTSAQNNLVSGKTRNDVIIGGQGTYVQLTSSNVNYDSGTGVFNFDVTVQNLIPQPMATPDGVSADPNGVEVFFSQGPTATALTDPSGSSSISIANADGTGTFTASNQPYFQYTGTLLGGDGILSQNETSSSKTWTFQVDPNVETFSFFLYVDAVVPHETGYVDITVPDSDMLSDSTQTLTGTVRTTVGNASGESLVWHSSDTTVAKIDSSTGVLTGVAPGLVTITASNPGATRTGTKTIAVCPDLAVGGTYVTSGSGASSICFAGGTSSQAEYTAVPFNGDLTNSIAYQTTGTGITAVTGPPTPDLIPGMGVSFRQNVGLTSMAAPTFSNAVYTDNEPTLRLRMQQGVPSPATGARIAQALSSTSQIGLRAFRSVGGIRKIITQGVVPTVGDSMFLNVAQGCSGTLDTRAGVVKVVSTHAIILADTANPAGGFTTAQYDSIALEFDTLAYPVDSTNFGAPTDQDGNGHIVLFFTRAVNELSPPASSSVTTGYFTNRDVYSNDPSTGCNLSNEGEVLYMLVPDPTGTVNSNVRTVSFVRGNTSRTTAHELQHLINAFRRTYVTGASSFEETWLDEGLSDIAEELMFYKTSFGLAPRQNIIVTNLTTGTHASQRVAAYNTFANNNFGRLRGWLQRPDTTGPYRGSGSSLAASGVLWAFLRYASDRVNGNDAAFWYSLVNSNLQGQSNIQNAIGAASLSDWYRDFDMSMYADDNGSFTVASQYTDPSWSYRSLYKALNGSYQLVPRSLTNGTQLSLTLQNGASSYIRFGVPANGFANLATSVSGSAPPSTMALVVMRTK